eukprot:2255055-Amphidinium_carterae.1
MYIFGWLPETEIDYYKNEGEDLLAEILHKICTPQEMCLRFAERWNGFRHFTVLGTNLLTFASKGLGQLVGSR